MRYTPVELPRSPASTSVLTRGRKLAIIVAIMLAAFGYFSYTAFESAQSFYLTVDELIELGPPPTQSVQVKGKLVEDSFVREGGTSTLAHFLLQENGAQVNATYDGVLPDLFFNPHSEIVLGGTYEDGGLFVADRVYVKCPSKYQSLEVDNLSDPPTV
ncbi:MAG: cytochrome c maturation protein CcmE [Chloroflexi bacterium]|nr:cytochrome c maturation protein CcmE [Chloroflexota bacterium]